MKNKPIIIVSGEPNSVFLEIFFKSLKFKKFKSPIILISSLNLLRLNMRKFKFKKKINLIRMDSLNNNDFNNDSINLINIDLDIKDLSLKNYKINKFIEKSFEVGLNILKLGITNKLINGPISKKNFLKKKYPGITEYLAKKTGTKKYAMLIYNDVLSVCPLTTHIPIKKVTKLITKKNIIEKINLIDDFYKKFRNIKPKIAITGLNPHCESSDKYNEDEKIIKPTVKHLKSLGYRISGPISADTIFLKDNRKKFDVILGMYHDQVLSPLKTLFEFDAINITLGLKFIRISPDHGPNSNMVGKNKSNPLSLISAINFLDKN